MNVDDSAEEQYFEYPAGFDPAAEYPPGFSVRKLVPKALKGLPVPGDASDGRDTLLGGDESDWLFGGGDHDQLDR